MKFMALVEVGNHQIPEDWGAEEVRGKPVGFWIIEQLGSLSSELSIYGIVDEQEAQPIFFINDESRVVEVEYVWEEEGGRVSLGLYFGLGELKRVVIYAEIIGQVMQSKLERKWKGDRLHVIEEGIPLMLNGAVQRDN
jgi:hypothetical protein